MTCNPVPTQVSDNGDQLELLHTTRLCERACSVVAWPRQNHWCATPPDMVDSQISGACQTSDIIVFWAEGRVGLHSWTPSFPGNPGVSSSGDGARCGACVLSELASTSLAEPIAVSCQMTWLRDV